MTATGSADLNRRACRPRRMRWAIWLVAACLAAGGTTAAAETSAPAPRLTVAVLTFEDQTADPEAAHWGYTLERLLADQLQDVKALRRVHAAFGYRQLAMKRGGPVSAEQARRIGEFVEARRVVWGAYHREGEKWLVTARVLNVATGQAGKELTAASADWYEVRDQLGDQVLRELGVNPTKAERRKMRRRGTTSTLALEWYSKAYAGQYLNRPRAELESCIRQALAAAPQFAEAYTALAAVLGSQGEFAPAEAAARQAVKLRPDSARAHDALGFVLMFQGHLAEAETALREALRLDPDEAETLWRLGECTQEQGHLDAAIALWNQAKQLDPTDAAVCAHLGKAYAEQHERDKALRELKAAERLDPDNVGAEQLIWQGYMDLHETPLALAHLERFVRLARKEGLQPKVVEYTEECGRELKALLTPHEITAVPPKLYTAQTLEAVLRERLTPEQYQQVVNPLAGTPAMDHWAQELASGATNDLDKARKIFEALARHPAKEEAGTRTAQEVFALWNDPGQSFSSQEFARLYVALARAVGVQTFFVHVEEDCSGDMVDHACAAVFADGKAFLVDPAYQWFGVPHKKYLILDDVQAIACQYYQPSVAPNQVARCQLAVKLFPDSAWGQVRLADALIKANDLVAAVLALKIAQQLEPGRWDTYTCQGLIAARTGDLKSAVVDLRQALELNPKYGPTHFVLAWVLNRQGKLAEARDQYHQALLYDSLLSSEDRSLVLRAIAEINEKLSGE